MNQIVKQRRKKYEDFLPSFSMSLFFSGKEITSSNDLFYPFIVNKNFYYLTEIEQSNSILMLLKGKEKTREFLFVERIDPSRALWIGEKLTDEEITRHSDIDNIYDIRDFENILSSILHAGRVAKFDEIDTIFLDINRQNIDELPSVVDFYAKKIKDSYPFVNIKSSHKIISEMRVIKDSIEIDNIQQAIDITKEGILNMMRNCRGGIFEYQLESYYDQQLKFFNTNVSFNSIVASGTNGTILHYEKNNHFINNDDLVLCDLGCNYHNYSSDITRTFPSNGKFSERQKQIYNIVLEANKRSIEFLKPGVTYLEFNEFGRNVLIEGLKKLNIIENDDEINKYYYHSLGHFLGLDVHDVGNHLTTIKPGMVITVEPGLYIKEENIGIRIEDDILITEDGNINLSQAIPKEIEQIEKIMMKEKWQWLKKLSFFIKIFK